MKLEFSKRFLKDLNKQPEHIRVAFKKRLELFIGNKYHPLLNNHKLTGGYRNCYSMNVTGDFRAVFEEYEDGEIIYFITIGSHSNLYR